MAKVKKNKAKRKRLSQKRVNSDSVKKVMNPFEVHVNRQKYEVLGRKTKHDKGLPGVARAKAINKRKNTLLQEFKIKDKSNKFLDKRIGEKNSAMTAEDRIMARFTAERMKKHNRKSIFNLADEEVLTHRGQTLSEIEKFDDPRSDDEDDQEKLDADFVEDAHFGGGILKKTSGGHSSRKDLIEQLIAESKKRKAEKQKAREQTIQLTEKLDTEWRDLLPIVSASKANQSNAAGDDNEDVKADSYDTVMRQLKFEARGKPSDRLKSEEELAKDEKEHLEQLEAERLQRMHGIKENATTSVKHKSADDLDDGFEIESDEEVAITYNEEGMLENHNMEQDEGAEEEAVVKTDDKSEESSEDDDDDDKECSEDNSDSLSDLKNKSDSEEEKEAETSQKAEKSVEAVKADLLARKQMMEQARKELPYTFKVPTSYEELQALLGAHSHVHQSVILERMIKCNHPSLGEGMKEKLCRLFDFLLQHIQDTAVSSKEHNCFALLDSLAPHLYDLCQLSPGSAGHAIAEVLREKQHDFRSHSRSFPGVSTLVFLKLVSLLFPTSDFRHCVTTPAMVFMCQMLTQCRIKTGRDVATGLFLVTLVLEYTVLSKRFSPGAINFLRGVLELAVTKKSVRDTYKIRVAARNMLVPDETDGTSEVRLMRFDDLKRKAAVDGDFRVCAVQTAVKLALEFCDNLHELSASYEIFKSLHVVAKQLDVKNYPEAVAGDINRLITRMDELSEKKLEYIVAEKKKPRALRLYEPRIEEVFDTKKRPLMSKVRQEREKLTHKYKREMKGAVREIRRDNTFLAKLKFKQTMQSDMERKRKVKEIFGSAANQQGELRALERKKK